MKNSIRLASAALLIMACGSQDTGSAKIPAPKVTIEQTSNVPAVAESVPGGLSVSLRMTVTNLASIPISLKRAEMVSVDEGGWDLRQTQREFDRLLQPGASETFDFWVEPQSGSSIAGNNAPVTLRLTTIFDSSQGAFKHVTVQHIGGRIQ